MQQIVSRLDIARLALSLSYNDLEGDTHRIASIVVSSCTYVVKMYANLLTLGDIETAISTLLTKYLPEYSTRWIMNNKGHEILLLLDKEGKLLHTGLCLHVVNEVMLIWNWVLPRYAFTEVM